MFGLFGKKAKLNRIDDRIFMTRKAALQALLADTKSAAGLGDTVVICSFFRQSLDTVSAALGNETPHAQLNQRPFPHISGGTGTILLCDAAQIGSDSILQAWIGQAGKGLHFYFCEHHPHLADEQKVLDALEQLSQEKPQVVCFYGGMDSPLFNLFGGERIVGLMQKMGMGENEVVSHSMVTKSIRNAQEKIAKKVTAPVSASSEEDWFARNMPS